MLSNIIALLACTVAASDQISSLPATYGDFTISRLPSVRSTGGRLVERPSGELKVSSNVVNLKRSNSASLSSSYIQAIRQEGIAVSRAKRAQSGTSPLIAVEGGNVFLAEATFGGETFPMVIDTGSSDPWIAITDFQCYDPYDDSEQEQAYCEFGPLYDPALSTTYSGPIPNQNFNISYADGEYLTGSMAYETVAMAGVTVANQEFATVNRAAWYGDAVSSGLIGFAYRTLTSAYSGTTGKGPVQLYNPLFANMYTNAGVPSIFSIAIDRDVEIGGVLALGGIPDIPHSPYFASTPIVPVGVNSTSGALVYQYYTIDINGFAYSNDSSTQFNPTNIVNPRKKSLVGNGTDIIVDSGTSLIYAPNNVAAGVAAAFNPPATYDASVASYYVDCDAKAPIFGVSIAKKIFYINSQDMIIALGDDTCVMGVQPNLGGLSILGDVFMKNVISVFDVGAEEMRFAARQFTSVM